MKRLLLLTLLIALTLPTIPALTEEQPPEPTIMPQAIIQLNKNPDYIGWIKIPKTVVDYPIYQTDDEDNDSPYLSDYHALYASSASDNPLIVFGHHMKSGKMFAVLEKYKQPKFAKEHSLINISTIYSDHTYQTCAVYRFKDGEGFQDLNGDGELNYQDIFGNEDPTTFIAFLQTYEGTYYYDAKLLNDAYVAARAEDPEAIPNLLILKTCTYRTGYNSGKKLKDAGLAVLAVEITP